MDVAEVFEKAHAFTAKWEGGLTDHPADPGGVTNYGVSLRFLQQEGIDVDGSGTIDAADVRAVTRDEAKRIFRSRFWTAALERLAAEHPRMAIFAYDAAVNMGPGRARRQVQKAVGAVPDGIWGPKTWAAIARTPDEAGAEAMLQARIEAYRGIVQRNRTLQCFLRGWLNRVEDLRGVAGGCHADA